MIRELRQEKGKRKAQIESRLHSAQVRDLREQMELTWFAKRKQLVRKIGFVIVVKY